MLLGSNRGISYWKRWALRWPARAPIRDEGGTLRDVQHDLSEFSGSAEKFFVPVGERLADLQLRSREIASQTTRIAGLLSQDDRSLAVLGEVLNAAEGTRRHDEILGAVLGIQENAVAVHRAIAAVVRLVNTFDVLGMMTRVESSRFEVEGVDFGGLAEAVTALSQQIREKIGATAESAAVLLQTSRQASEEVRRVAQTRQENLGPLTRQTGVGLSEIADHRNRVSHANTLLAARFDGVSSAVGDIVTAVQFHDIVRQQIEHVLEALRLLHRPGSSADLFETARLQAAQLENSRATFQRSVEQIRNGLAQIESNIGEVAGESGRLVGSSGDDASFFTSVEADLASILAILGRNANAGRNLAETAISVHQRVSEMSGTIAGVHAVGIEMQRIALNAAIQAAHLGPGGEALEIIAQAIQGLARESEAASGGIENLLGNTRTAVMALEQATGGSNGSDELMERLRENAAALKRVQDEAHGGYLRALELIAGMKQQVGETIAIFGAADGCLEVLAHAHEMLRGLSIDARRTGSPAAGLAASAYTMQSERAVHETLYDTAPGNREAPGNGDFPPANAPAAVEGDNVEFF